VQTALLVVAILGIVAFVGSFVILVLGILREIRKIGQATETVSETLDAVKEELTATAQDARVALQDVDRLTLQVTSTAERVDRVTEVIEHLVDGAHAASAAAKAMRSSTAGIAGVLEGIKQGIRTLYGR
jgi:uncharacterized protein YoxC